MNSVIRTYLKAPLGRLSATAVLACAVALPASAQQVLKFAVPAEANHYSTTEIYQPWADAINEEAEGEFRIQLFGPAFAPVTQIYDRVASGVAEMGVLFTSATGQPFARTSVSTIPMVADSPSDGAVALWTLYEEGMLGDEFDDFHVFNIAPVAPNVLISKQVISSMDDLEGMKVRVLDKNTADHFEQMGASPIAVQFSEAYQALDSGLVSAALSNGNTIAGLKFGEVAPNQITNVTFGMMPTAIVMNKDTWDGLSDKAKEIFNRHTGAESSRWVGQQQMVVESKFHETLRADPDYTYHELSDEEVARWQAATDPVVQGWIERTPDGQQVLDRFVEAYEASVATN